MYQTLITMSSTRRDFLKKASLLSAAAIAVPALHTEALAVGMGVVIVGGTMFSLLLTLYVIPGFYLMFSKKRKHRPEFDTIED